MEERFEYIKEQAKAMAKRQSACKEGFKRLVEAENFGQFCAVLQKYWSEIIPMIRKDGFRFFREVYPTCKEELNRCGIYFNESTDKGKAIVTEGSHTFRSEARVWAYGESNVDLYDNARCTANEESYVVAYDNAVVQLLDLSQCAAYGRSKINANGKSTVQAYDSCVVTAGEESRVFCMSWNTITAVGNAQVFAPSSYKIKLLGQAKLTIKKQEDL